MARVTVEDCIKVVQNRFELVALGSQRAKEIASGAKAQIHKNDKDPIIALREIASNLCDIPQLRESLIQSMQTQAKTDIIAVDDDSDDSAAAHSMEQTMKSDLGAESLDIEEDLLSDADDDFISPAPDEAADADMFSDDNLSVDD